MPVFDVPGFATLDIEHLVLDYNGTLARDGKLLPGASERLAALAESFSLHVLTADTFGSVAAALAEAPCVITVIPKGNEGIAKLEKVRELGTGRCACLGNGRNDAPMLREAALGIALVQAEGAAREAVMSADVVVTDVRDALDLFLIPGRLIATLRD